jgi:predicted nucleic acid-binding Zn ribbon protein
VPGEVFCDFCGSPLEAPAPAPEAAAPASEAAVAEAAPSVEPEATLPAAEAKAACPACGAIVLSGEAFCADCGASLDQSPVPPEPVPEVTPSAVPDEATAAPAAEPQVTPAEEPAKPAVEAATPMLPAPAAKPTCAACGDELEPGDKFCSNCGALQEAAPAVPAALLGVQPVGEAAAPTPPALGARLVVVASGAEIPLPAKDEILIGREDPVSGIFPDIDLTPHGGEDGGVSRRHARIVVEGGTYYIVDLNSTNLTYVNRQRLAPDTRQPLKDGDDIRCGRVSLVFKLA